MISYAQNFEDVLLARVFRHKPSGFYIDVGAHDPVSLSVTRHFYDLGWHGINIEPVPECHRRFVEQRPRDINLQLALGDQSGVRTLHVIRGSSAYVADGAAMSTFVQDAVAPAAHVMGDLPVQDIQVDVRTLAEVCDVSCREPVDFLKIDVEGWERPVLEGADFTRFRPVVVVVEATRHGAEFPGFEKLDTIAAWPAWEPLLLAAGYRFAYFDGLNRFYVREEDAPHVLPLFAVPAGLYDGFQLADPRWTSSEARARIVESDPVVRDLRQQAARDAAEAGALRAKLADAEQQRLQADQERRSAEDRHEAARNEALRELMGLREQSRRLATETEAARKALQLLKPRAQWLESERERLLAETAAQASRRLEAERRLDAVRERHLRLENEVARLREQCRQLETWGEGLRETLGSLAGQARAGARREQELSAGNQALTDENRRLGDECEELRQTLNVVRQVAREFDYRRRNRLWLALVREIPVLARVRRIVQLPPVTEPPALPGRPGLTTTSRPAPAGPGPSRPPPARPSAPASLLRPGAELSAGPPAESVATESGKALCAAYPSYWPGLLERLRAALPAAPSRRSLDLFVEHSVSRDADGPPADVGLSQRPTDAPAGWFDAPSRAALLKRCRVVASPSMAHARALREHLGLAPAVLRLPLPPDRPEWSWAAFADARRIVQPAEWLQRLHALAMLPLRPPLLKLRWHNDRQAPRDAVATEQEQLVARRLLLPSMSASCPTEDEWLGERRVRCLAESVVFLHLSASCLPVTLLECIAGATPIVINALPAVVELLGGDYPLYYHSYLDAARKLADDALVRRAHEHLKALPCRAELTVGNFLNELDRL